MNALSVLGTNLLAATVWRMEGEPVTNGVSVADLLCTNGVLRTPAAFELRWKNTTGLDPEADTDNDGLTDWAETFLWGTDPNHADTDADGIADNVELMTGADPLNADEDGDGVPDGTSAADWAANTLWAANSVDGGNMAITLNEAIPEGASATLVLGGLAIPLRGTNTMEFCLPFGETTEGRLFSSGINVVKLSISPKDEPEQPVLLRGGPSSFTPRLRDDPRGVLDGNSNEGTFRIAIPEVIICNPDGTRAESECIHTSDGNREYIVRFEPGDWGLSLDNCIVDGFERIGGNRLRLSVGDDSYDDIVGRVWLVKYVDYGFVEDSVLLWRCSMPADEEYPAMLEVNPDAPNGSPFKRILARHSTNPVGRPTVDCRLTVTNGSDHAATVHISGPKLRFGPNAAESLTVTIPYSGAHYDFVVSGEVASEAMDDAVITVRRDGPSGPVCATAALTVVWVDPITMRCGQNDAFSSDNACLVKPVPPLLGLQSYSFGSGNAQVGNIVEFRGLVHPADFTEEVHFARDYTDEWLAGEQPGCALTVVTNNRNCPRVPSVGNDDPPWECQSAHVSINGFVFDFDTPGLPLDGALNQEPGTLLYARLNYLQYATWNGIRCSNDLAWHCRFTFKNGEANGTGSPGIWSRPGHPTDNSVGLGFTTIGRDE